MSSISLADDLGYGELGSYGQALIKTPNLDRLAKPWGYGSHSIIAVVLLCAPSRCTLLTGLHTVHCQIRDSYELGGFADSFPWKKESIRLGI